MSMEDPARAPADLHAHLAVAQGLLLLRRSCVVKEQLHVGAVVVVDDAAHALVHHAELAALLVHLTAGDTHRHRRHWQ